MVSFPGAYSICSLQCLSAILQVPLYCLKVLISLVFCGPLDSSDTLVSHQHSKLEDTETNPFHSSPKSQNIGCILHSSLPFPREKLQGRLFLLFSSCSSLEEELTWLKYNSFSYPFSAIVLGFELACGTLNSYLNFGVLIKVFELLIVVK